MRKKTAIAIDLVMAMTNFVMLPLYLYEGSVLFTVLPVVNVFLFLLIAYINYKTI